jgi:hypothetical protein
MGRHRTGRRAAAGEAPGRLNLRLSADGIGGGEPAATRIARLVDALLGTPMAPYDPGRSNARRRPVTQSVAAASVLCTMAIESVTAATMCGGAST